jgi:hypothetical protein
MAETLDKELAEQALLKTGLLPGDARGAVFAVRDIQGDGAPSRGRQVLDLLQQAGCAAAQGKKEDPGFIKMTEGAVGGELGVED